VTLVAVPFASDDDLSCGFVDKKLKTAFSLLKLVSVFKLSIIFTHLLISPNIYHIKIWHLRRPGKTWKDCCPDQTLVDCPKADNGHELNSGMGQLQS